jgi:EAL domain-containing protein (putative c-di-GMP-specific phosphodiesterase class I)
VAMYLAKERQTGVEAYSRGADRQSVARLSLLGDLRRGLDRGELELHYQPKVYLPEGGTCGMEALLRWRHPERGMILPGEFIPAIEQSSLLPELTAFVVDAALTQAALWRRSGLSVPVCLNLAPRDLLDIGLTDLIRGRLAKYGLAPGDLMLEINEGVLAGEPAQAVATTCALAALGVPISLDDFGTASSSLVRLKRLPVSEVKVDVSIITRLFDPSDNELIVRSLVGLVRALGIRSVAEGVETAEVAAALTAMGCDAAQGWCFSRPLDPMSATRWLASHHLVAAVCAPASAVAPRSASSDPATPRSASSDPATPRSASSDPATPPRARQPAGEHVASAPVPAAPVPPATSIAGD